MASFHKRASKNGYHIKGTTDKIIDTSDFQMLI